MADGDRHADVAPRGRPDRVRVRQRRRHARCRRMRGLLGRRTLPAGRGHRAPPRLVDPHGLHALSDRRRLPRRGAGRHADRAEPPPVQDRFLPRRARGRRARRRRVRAARPRRRATGSPGPRATSSTTSPTQGSPALAGRARGTVLVASGDQRFVKLARFLLEGRGFAVGDQPVAVALARLVSRTPTSTPSSSTGRRAWPTASAP